MTHTSNCRIRGHPTFKATRSSRVALVEIMPHSKIPQCGNRGEPADGGCWTSVFKDLSQSLVATYAEGVNIMELLPKDKSSARHSPCLLPPACWLPLYLSQRGCLLIRAPAPAGASRVVSCERLQQHTSAAAATLQQPGAGSAVAGSRTARHHGYAAHKMHRLQHWVVTALRLAPLPINPIPYLPHPPLCAFSLHLPALHPWLWVRLPGPAGPDVEKAAG